MLLPVCYPTIRWCGGVLSLLWVCHFFVSLHGYGFLSGGKARGVKFCMRVGLLSGQVFFPLVNIGSRGVTGAAALLPG